MVDISKILNVDMQYPGIDIKVELRILKDYLAHLEAGVNEIGEQYILNERSNFQGCEYHEYRHIYDIAEEEFPRLIKLPFLMAIHTAFESSIVRLLNYTKDKESAGLALKDLDGRQSNLRRFNKYLKHVVKYDFQFEKKFEHEFANLSKIRNCVAHANGVIEALSDEHRDGIRKLINEKIGVSQSSGGMDVSYEFLRKSINSVAGAVEGLMQFMELHYKFYR